MQASQQPVLRGSSRAQVQSWRIHRLTPLMTAEKCIDAARGLESVDGAWESPEGGGGMGVESDVDAGSKMEWELDARGAELMRAHQLSFDRRTPTGSEWRSGEEADIRAIRKEVVNEAWTGAALAPREECEAPRGSTIRRRAKLRCR